MKRREQVRNRKRKQREKEKTRSIQKKMNITSIMQQKKISYRQQKNLTSSMNSLHTEDAHVAGK